MSGNSAEQQLGQWLREIPGTWVHHPVDHPKARYWKPADFVVAWAGQLVLVESKEVSRGSRFPLSNWTAQQRNHARAVREGDGAYVLVVHFKALHAWALYPVAPCGRLGPDERGSLTPDQGHAFEDVRTLSDAIDLAVGW